MCAAKEGMNLALIYNTSSALVSGSASCPGGLACLLEQVGEAVVRAWHNTLQGEMGLFQEVPTLHRYCHDASTLSCLLRPDRAGGVGRAAANREGALQPGGQGDEDMAREVQQVTRDT